MHVVTPFCVCSVFRIDCQVQQVAFLCIQKAACAFAEYRGVSLVRGKMVGVSIGIETDARQHTYKCVRVIHKCRRLFALWAVGIFGHKIDGAHGV